MRSVLSVCRVTWWLQSLEVVKLNHSCSGKELPLLKKKMEGENSVVDYLHFIDMLFISLIVAGGARSSGKHLCKHI